MPKDKSNFEWENDPYAQRWIEGLAEKSREVYKYGFNNWMLFIEMSPKEQIDKRIRDLQNDNPKIRGFFEDKVLEYKNRLETQGYVGKTLLNKTTPIRSFFTAHRVSLSFRRGELTTKKQKKNLIKFSLSNEEVRAMHDIASVRGRAVMLVLYQSGFSPVDTLGLNIGDVIDAFRNENEHYVKVISRSKTGVVQATCISYEAIYEIKSLLKQRGLKVKEILENKEHPARKEPLFLTPRGERLTPRFLNDAMKGIVQKALPEDRASQFKTKSLRDSYNCALLESDLKQEIKDLLFGHRRLSARSEYAFTEGIIKQAYIKAFKKLSINGHRQTKKAIAQLEEKFDISVSALSDTVARQKTEIEEIKANYEKLESMLELVIKGEAEVTVETQEEYTKRKQKEKEET